MLTVDFVGQTRAGLLSDLDFVHDVAAATIPVRGGAELRKGSWDAAPSAHFVPFPLSRDSSVDVSCGVAIAVRHSPFNRILASVLALLVLSFTGCRRDEVPAVSLERCPPIPREGMGLWLDAERDLVTSDSKVFEGWHDRVGGKFLEAQGTEGSASWAVVGGHRVLRLYGPAFFRVDRLAGHGRSFSIAIVLQALSQEGNSQMFGGGADSNAFLSHSGPGGVLYVGTGPVIERRFELGPGSIPDAGLHEMVYVQDGPHARLYLEGSPPLSKEIGESGEWAGFEIGSSTGLGSFSGDIAEVLVYDRALSEIEAGQVRRYLHARYGSPEGCAPTDGENAGRGDG